MMPSKKRLNIAKAPNILHNSQKMCNFAANCN